MPGAVGQRGKLERTDKSVCALTNSVQQSVAVQVSKPGLKRLAPSISCFLNYLMEPSYYAMRKFKQPMERYAQKGTENPDQQPS